MTVFQFLFYSFITYYYWYLPCLSFSSYFKGMRVCSLTFILSILSLYVISKEHFSFQTKAFFSLIKTCLIPRSNRHSHKRPYTKKYHDLHGPVLWSYIFVSYTEEYGDIRTPYSSTWVFYFTNYLSNLHVCPFLG